MATSNRSKQPVVSTQPPILGQNTQGTPSFWGWFNEYLNAVIGIAALGGQITFTVIVSDIADPSTLRNSGPGPEDDGATKEKVRFFIALSWLFFTATLGLAVVAKILFTNGPQPSPTGGNALRAIYSGLTLVLNMLPIAAFLLLALATTAYVPTVGWVGVALISLLGLFVLVLWFILDTGV
ncbi:hypothetical protein QBC43DRAFT_327191 [Cladorrhinum sp. PSN259]|nr:hypothetical protein QBC43DRAFT_327191 [Cladorrhinum sp. PSN259]